MFVTLSRFFLKTWHCCRVMTHQEQCASSLWYLTLRKPTGMTWIRQVSRCTIFRHSFGNASQRVMTASYASTRSGDFKSTLISWVTSFSATTLWSPRLLFRFQGRATPYREVIRWRSRWMSPTTASKACLLRYRSFRLIHGPEPLEGNYCFSFWHPWLHLTSRASPQTLGSQTCPKSWGGRWYV